MKVKTVESFGQSLTIAIKGNFVPKCRWSVSVLELPVTEIQSHFPVTLREETYLALFARFRATGTISDPIY